MQVSILASLFCFFPENRTTTVLKAIIFSKGCLVSYSNCSLASLHVNPRLQQYPIGLFKGCTLLKTTDEPSEKTNSNMPVVSRMLSLNNTLDATLRNNE